MTENQKYFIKLCKAAIFEEQPELPPEEIDWEYIWSKAKEQNISGLVASAVLKLPEEHLPLDTEVWNEVIMQTMFVMSRKFAEFGRMMAKLKENGIEPICLKGIVVKDLYPVPELRTMGDFDIFVKKSSISAIKELFKTEGYDVSDEPVGITAKKENIFWEIFDTLEQEFRENTDACNTAVLSTAEKAAVGMYVPGRTYMLAHMILHFGEHLIYAGSGIRNLLDIVLFLRKYSEEIDFEKVLLICEEQYFENLYRFVMTAVKVYFDVEATVFECAAVVFMESLLSGGVFGEAGDNVMIRQAARQEGNAGIVRRLFFPSAEMIDTSYAYLKKHKWLLPFAWIHRLFRARIHRGYTFRAMIGGLGDSVRYAKKHDRRMDELKIYSKNERVIK